MKRQSMYGVSMVFGILLLLSGCVSNVDNTSGKAEAAEDNNYISTGIPVRTAEEWPLDISYTIPDGHKEVSGFDAEGQETIILVPEETAYTKNVEAADCEIYRSTVIIEAAPIELCVFEDSVLKHANTNVNAVEVSDYAELELENNHILFGEARALLVNKTDYNALIEQGIELSEEELFQEHWCAFFGQENSERAVMVLLSKDYFRKEEAVQWLQQIGVTDNTFSR